MTGLKYLLYLPVFACAITISCFTESGEAEGNCRYNERSSARAFRLMDAFFAEKFAAK